MTDGSERSSLSDRIREATFQFLSRRNRGDPISPEEFCAEYPDLMPGLAESVKAGTKRLRFVEEIRDAAGVRTDRPSLAPASNPFPIVRGYQLRREITGGGQGTVFEAVHERTGRTVAVKVVDSVASRNFERFEREVSSLARLDHPGIVGVLDRGRTAAGAHFLVMEYVAGCDLDAWIDGVQGSADAQRTILKAFAEIAAALEIAHAAGIIHRDLKPSNVRVSPAGKPRIIDFGLAHQLNAGTAHGPALTVTGNIVGSVPWAVPAFN